MRFPWLMRIGGTEVDKGEYVRRSLSKMRQKPWELYVISRIVHRLNDPDIEFVPQQLVRLESGRRALTDLYFPQFDLHFEVNEGHHFEQAQTEADEARNYPKLLRAASCLRSAACTNHSKASCGSSGTPLPDR